METNTAPTADLLQRLRTWLDAQSKDRSIPIDEMAKAVDSTEEEVSAALEILNQE